MQFGGVFALLTLALLVACAVAYLQDEEEEHLMEKSKHSLSSSSDGVVEIWRNADSSSPHRRRRRSWGIGGITALHSIFSYLGGRHYLGCYKDIRVPRALSQRLSGRRHTIDSCIQRCKDRDYTYAGLQWKGVCFCGDSGYNRYGSASESECNTACNADKSQICGGPFRNSVYRTESAACGADKPLVLSDTTGLVISPGFGQGGYSNNQNCAWNIIAPVDQVITLQFTSFEVEDHSSCRFDQVLIYDGRNAQSTRLAHLCGSTSPETYTSTNRNLFIVFTTDGTVTKAGFVATYTFEMESLCEYPGKPEHGDVFGTWPAKVQSKTTFDCDPGYALIGTEMIECKADQTWTGQIPQCQRMTCPEPEKKDHVQILNSHDIYTYGEEVWYICDVGYLLRGPESRQCKAHDGTINGRWTGFDPICLAVRCDDLMDPINGERHGHVLTYGSFVTFNCSTGYKLVGSYKMMCMSSGRWYGRFPECVQIECDAPLEPVNGEVRLRNAMYGAAVSFQCDDGFHLVGNRVLRCEESGNWNGSEPTCEAATCGNPGIPVHGAKDGSIFYYPHQVRFSCFTGYILRGVNTTSCQSDGTWSSTLPVCEACPRGTYMDDTHEEKQCKTCPEFSHTLTDGSTSRHQCVCTEGYTGPAGGPCQGIRCPTLVAPEFGTINDCANQLNHSCLFNCDDGYILDKGASMRTCQSNGQWDGTHSSCSSCEKDTYKSNVRSCMPCPVNSHAEGVANMLEDCVCDSGYQGLPGGPCIDEDECQENPCSDLCENGQGDYKCTCSIPGYGLDPDDQHTCIVENQCKNLTEADAPLNGGLVCHWYHEGNAQYCTNKCNKGFELPTRSNDYESCGPNTEYKWTFRTDDPQANITECIEEFFPGIQVEGETNYFVRACADLTEEEKLDVKNTFVAKLNENDICAQSASKNCDINDMTIICGVRQLRRHKRGVDKVLHSIDFSFNITALKIFGKVHNCSEICAMSPIPDRFCVEEFCISVTMRYMRAAVMHAKRQLGDLFATSEGRDNLTFTAARREFEAESAIIKDLKRVCPEGMRSQDELCVPCNPGFYYEHAEDNCLPCPMGMYQNLTQQTSCEICPEGRTSYKNGSLSCEVCRNNTFGVRCEQTCQCSENGKCDDVTGKCHCQNGWGGDRCEIDINGCDSHGCYQGVLCTDIPAPGSGFECGPCPLGLQGDGSTCL